MALLAMSNRQRLALVALLAVGAAVAVYISFFTPRSTYTPDATLRSQMTDGAPRTSLQVGDRMYRARVVTSARELQHGLSGTRSLQADDAMLFVFSRDDTWGIWMKDMFIPIDIVWLDKDKRIVHVVEHIAPDTYPKVFSPPVNARYVVELAAGGVSRGAIKTGMTAIFSVAKEGV